MALAILELIDADETQLWFKADTGTNTLCQLKVGRGVREDQAGARIDDVYFSSPVLQHEQSSGLFDGARRIAVPLAALERGRSYAQLFSSKAGGKAHTFSDVIALDDAMAGGLSRAEALSLTGRGATVIGQAAQPHKPPRAIAHRASYARPASLETFLSELVKHAMPIVTKMVQGAPGSGQPAAGGSAQGAPGTTVGSPASPTSAAAASPSADQTPEWLAQLLKTALAAITAKAQTLSTPTAWSGANRFTAGQAAQYAEPFILGIDDALIAGLIGSAIGPIVQALPQLVNAANQKRLELKKADNKLVTDILSDINKRLIVDKVLDAQKAAAAQGPAAPISPEQLQALVDLAAQIPAAPATAQPPAAPTPTASTNSLRARSRVQARAARVLSKPSARAVVALELETPVDWNGSRVAVFDRSRVLVLRPRLVVREPAPKAPLPKAILTLTLRQADNPDVRHEKVVKLKNVLPNSEMECRVDPGELAHLPVNARIAVIASLRWRSADGKEERCALGSTELVLVNRYFLKSVGAPTSAELELKDMGRYRAFWNRIWDAPSLSLAPDGDAAKRKYAWELDVDTRYTVLLSASHDSNGSMETRILREADDPESMTLAVRGRMKAGMELSVAELNKLLPLWNGASPLDVTKLEALQSHPFLEGAARECRRRIKLRGRAGEQGIVWAVPVFKLFGLTLSAAAATNEAGQVTSTAEETVQFPLPVALRLIGLKSSA